MRRCSPGAADAPIRDSRTSPLTTLSSEVGKVAQRAGARLLVLNHFVPVGFDRDALLGEVTADFAGAVVIGEDLLTIDVPRRAVAFAGLRLALGSAHAGKADPASS